MRLTVACSKFSDGGDGAKKKWVGKKQRGRWGREVGREGEVKTTTETEHHGMAFTRHENNKNRSL